MKKEKCTEEKKKVEKDQKSSNDKKDAGKRLMHIKGSRRITAVLLVFEIITNYPIQYKGKIK